MKASKITASTPLLPLRPGFAWRALCRLALPWLPLALHAAGAADLVGGPMSGPATSERVGVWLMTDAPAQVQLEYWPQGQPGAVRRSAPVAAGPERGHTARVDLDGLQAATRYTYRVLLDGNPVELGEPPAFTTAPADPAAPRELLIATGSCNYVPDPPYVLTPDSFGAGFEIFDTVAARRPDLMLWLGDSIYYRDDDFAPADQAAARMHRRWAATRRFAPLQRLLRTGQHVAIWDDHDYGPDNANRDFALKAMALALFQDYWANPGYGLPGVAGTFTRVPLGDVELFLLDDRYHRDDDAGTDPARTMLGAAQLEWLKGALRNSRASFKLLTNGSRMLSDRPSPEQRGGEGWHNFPAERQAFLDWLAAERIDGVFFVSGDIHYTHLTERERPGTYPLTELTCSPLTARVHPRPFPVREVPGTLVTQRNFCTLQFSGPAGARVLRVAAWDAAGTHLWEAEFPAARLRTR
ncbi:alkaline phosphatase D family protein [Thauera aromatica]|uniref:Phosphodiesterase/alkaline phosphatase D n=1 Tax=Thauera aromatica K172 TaxID=44139 RepID=A0A2R4BL28_THAAR|nr:alkaline phosphatase D family protein [Thauera aromatica]AVR88029.1 phosphodiesterase/alkaline phosphatase D [Thauera aromatica K172]